MTVIVATENKEGYKLHARCTGNRKCVICTTYFLPIRISHDNTIDNGRLPCLCMCIFSANSIHLQSLALLEQPFVKRKIKKIIIITQQINGRE